MIVVDSTVLGDLLFNGGKPEQSALELYDWDPHWICLGFARFELGNIAWKYARFSDVDVSSLRGGFEVVDNVVSEFVTGVDWPAVLRLAVRKELTFYDAAHVWLALDRDLPLFTRDKEILRKCKEIAEPMPSV